MNRGQLTMAAGALGILVLLAFVLLAVTGQLLTDRDQPIRGSVVIDDGEPYAYLAAAPDDTPWVVGESRTVWLSTNIPAVSLRISDIDVGLGNIHRQTASGDNVLAASLGCLDHAVSLVVVSDISGTSFAWTVTINPGSTPVNQSITAYMRASRADGEVVGLGLEHAMIPVAEVGIPIVRRYEVPSFAGQMAIITIEASTDVHFSHVDTRRVTFTLEDGAPDASSHETLEELHMAPGLGVEIIGCHEHEDVVVSLHDEATGIELNRYTLDVLAAPPTPTPTPDFGQSYDVLRFCPGDVTDRASYLTGGESVGPVQEATGTSITYGLAAEGDYAFFAVSNSGDITVSPAGADDHTGLDGTRLYNVVIRASDPYGGVAEVPVTLQLDLANTGVDGRCS